MNNIHNQMMLNIVINHAVACRVYNRAEAAAWIKENVQAYKYSTQKELESTIKSAFEKGGRVANFEGVKVVKTKTPAKWRGRAYHIPSQAARRRKLRAAYAGPTVVTWRR